MTKGRTEMIQEINTPISEDVAKQLKVGDEITYIPTWEDVKGACPFPYINQLKEEVLRLTGIPKENFNQ